MKNNSKTKVPHEGQLFIGDNLPIMLNMDPQSVDLIYLDPPFKTETFRRGKTEKHSFVDTWTEKKIDEAHAYHLKFKYPEMWQVIILAEKLHSYAMHSYLVFMASRLVAMHRLLKPTGSLYLHCDHNAVHYLKLLLDAIFGEKNFRNEIVWGYDGPSSPKMKQFSRKHDTILFYADRKRNTWNWQAVAEQYADNSVRAFGSASGWGERSKYAKRGKYPRDIFLIPSLKNTKERTGYDTQKPLALLNRIIAASSNEGDLVLDPFCGCATTLVAAAGLHRRWAGIDQNEDAVEIFQDRLAGDLSTVKFKTYADPGAKVERSVRLPKPKFNYPGKVTMKEAWNRLVQMDVKKGVQPFCRGCFDTPKKELLEVDHILAESVGGLSVMENLQLLCGRCNKKKGDKDMDFLYRVLDDERAKMRRQVAQGKLKG